MPDFVAPQLCTSVERPPDARGLVPRDQVRRLPRAAAVRGRRGRAEDPQGLDWTDKFGAIAEAAKALPDALIDGEIVALDHNGAPGFLRAAGGAVGRQDRRSDLLCFDLLFADGEDLRALPLRERKARLKTLLERAQAARKS